MTRRPGTAFGIAVLGIASLRLAACGGKSGSDQAGGASSGTSGATAIAGSGNGGGSGDGSGGSSRGGSGTGGSAAGMPSGGNGGRAGTANAAAGSGVTPGPGCDHDGTHYEDGASWPVDCRQCFCEVDQIACTTQACPSEVGGMGGMAGGASAGTGGDAGEPGVKPNCMLEVGSLCIVGTPTDAGHELSVGMPMVFALKPEGCFSSSCTQLVESSCSYIGSTYDFYVSGFFCVTTEGDACTDDCGGAPEAICDAETMLTAGSYTVSLSGRAGATQSPLHFTVPGVVLERERCTHPL